MITKTNMWEMIGFMASILSASTFVPEVIQALKTKHLNDIAWGMLMLLTSNCFLWIIYASYFGLFPVLLSSSLNLLMGIMLVVIKWKAERKVQLIEVKETVRIPVIEV